MQQDNLLDVCVSLTKDWARVEASSARATQLAGGLGLSGFDRLRVKFYAKLRSAEHIQDVVRDSESVLTRLHDVARMKNGFSGDRPELLKDVLPSVYEWINEEGVHEGKGQHLGRDTLQRAKRDLKNAFSRLLKDKIVHLREYLFPATRRKRTRSFPVVNKPPPRVSATRPPVIPAVPASARSSSARSSFRVAHKGRVHHEK